MAVLGGDVARLFEFDKEAWKIALDDAADACEAKSVERPAGDVDEAYNRAVKDCADAVRALSR